MPDKKGGYKQALRDRKLEDDWKVPQQRAFTLLKNALLMEPVLRPPRFDGSPFIVITDGSMHGFGAVLAQRWNDTTPKGEVVERVHPICFVSKRASRTEEKYKQFDSEIVALKFALDKFHDTIIGWPVEIETDCQALANFLSNDNLPAVQARRKEAILAHSIVSVRHRSGKSNFTDGLSRMWAGHQREGDDWTVSPDWDSVQIPNDLFGVEQAEADQLRTRFKDDPYFLSLIDAVEGKPSGKQAFHRAKEFYIEEGKLMRLAPKASRSAAGHTECLTRAEAKEAVAKAHGDGGHMGRDVIMIQLNDKYFIPGLRNLVRDTILECGQCKNFGPKHLNSLLQPITRRYPLEMIAGDYLSLPNGKGGFHTVGLYVDVFSQFVWGDKLKTAGTAKTTVKSLERIANDFAPPTAFMADGGRHFDAKEVDEWCESHQVEHITTPAYSPWVNGLIENSNKIFLKILRRLCAPDLDDIPEQQLRAEDIPNSWPTHFQTALNAMNDRIIPHLKFCPRELLLGLPLPKPQPSSPND